MKRGVVYIVWGDKIEGLVQQSIASVKRFYPDMPVHVERVQNLAEGALLQKAKMGSITPFESTLYLDADTVVLGNLDHAFERAEQFGLACCICECPWTRRYGAAEGDNIEYNTGVVFFTRQSRPVFDLWEKLAPTAPSNGKWWSNNQGRLFGSKLDDQASFAWAIQEAKFNPFVLPLNYNFRPNFSQSLFCPVKIWHSPVPVAPGLAEMSTNIENNQSPVTYVLLKWQADPQKG